MERHAAFLSPHSSHGVLIQPFSGYSAWSLANEYETAAVETLAELVVLSN